MPYTIVKQDDKFCLRKRDTGAIVAGSCHADRAETERMGRAILASEHKAVTVKQGEDGARYMTLVTSNSYKDREDEYISAQALTDWVDKQWDGEQFKSDNKLDFWHMPTPTIGALVWADMQGTFLTEVYKERESGLPFVRHFTRAIWDYIEKQDNFGASHLFIYDPEQVEEADDGRVYHAIDKRRSTALPIEYAANPYTFSGVLTMTDTQKKKRDGLLDNLFGPGFAGTLRSLVGRAEEKLEQSGIEHKAIGPTVTRDDFRDAVLIATKEVVKAVSENDGEETIAIADIVDDVIAALMTVPATNVADYEAILAVDPEPGETKDEDETETAPAVDDEFKALVTKAITAYGTVTQDNAALLAQQMELVTAMKALGDLPAAISAMANRIALLEKQLAGRSKRASRAAETEIEVVTPDLVAQVDAALKAADSDGKTYFDYPAKES